MFTAAARVCVGPLGVELVLVPEGNTVEEMGLINPCDTNTKVLLIIEFVSFRSQINWQSNRTICLEHPQDSSQYRLVFRVLVEMVQHLQLVNSKLVAFVH